MNYRPVNTLKSMSNGRATKIIFPFEISRLMENASEYIGAGHEVPEHSLSDNTMLEVMLGKADDVLENIPTAEDMRKQMKSIDTFMDEEMDKENLD